MLISLFVVVDKASAVVPPQCWEAGCCGPSLKYNQWSCVTSSFKCSGSGGYYFASYYCSTSQKSHSNPIACRSDCPGDSQCDTLSCLSTDGWAKFCEIKEGTIPCTAGNNSCTANLTMQTCKERADGSDCDFFNSTDVRDCWVGGATPTPAPGETPPPPNNPPPPQFPQTIKVIGVVFEDDNGNGNLDSGEQILGPRGGVTNYTYTKSGGGTRTVDCDSAANSAGKVKEAIDTPLNIKHVASNGITQLGNATMCYGGYIEINSSGDAFIEGAVDCATTWGGSCTRYADCNCIEYTGIKCLAESDCSSAPAYKTKKDNQYKARSNSFYAKLRDFGLNSNFIGPAMSWNATQNQLIPVWGMYTINVDNNEKLKIRVPDTYQITRTYLISTRGNDDPLVAPDEPAVIRNLGITDTVGGWDAGVANTSAVVVWGIRTKRATIRAKAHSITSSDSCTTLRARPTVAPADFTLAPLYTTKTQTGANYVEWNDLAVPGAFEPYRVDATPSALVVNEYLPNESLVCQYKNNDVASAIQSAAVNATKGDLFDVEFGYKPKTLSIQIRAKSVPATSSCTGIRNSANGLNLTTFSFTQSATDPLPSSRQQSNNAYALFDSLLPGMNTIHVEPASGIYEPLKWCMKINTDPVTTSDVFDISTGSLNSGDSVVIDVGFKTNRSWVQTDGGDVYADNITSYLPGSTKFNRTGAAGFPGIISFQSGYDFKAAAGNKGEGNVSSTGWLVQESLPVINYYQLLYTRFGSPITDNYTALYAGGKPTINGTYFVNGDLTTTAQWNLVSGDSYVVIVNGNLNFNYRVTAPVGSFIAFIVKGNINIASSVGVQCDATVCSDTTERIQGVYITSPTGIFKTNIGNAAKERLLLRGTFVAGSFQLERDLNVTSGTHNSDTPAETFIYEPDYLFQLPNEMKELPVTWQEVAP